MAKFLKLPFGGTAYPIEDKSRKNTLKSVKKIDKKVGNSVKNNNTKFHRKSI